MLNRGKFAAFIACSAALSACSLFVSLDGLTSGSAGSGDASLEAGDATGSDASGSDAAPTDASSNSDAADASAVFLDDFNRPDAALIGNGWIEKRPIAFTLGGDAVVRAMTDNVDYPDNMVYRPPAEDIRDSAVSIELTFAASIAGFPQIHSRIQENTVAMVGTVDSYLLYIPNDKTNAILSRTRGAENLSDLATSTLTESLVAGERYRLTLRVSGADPVSLLGQVEHFTLGNWVMIGQASALDSDPTRLDTAGSTGFSCSTMDVDPYRYDNFTRTPL